VRLDTPDPRGEPRPRLRDPTETRAPAAARPSRREAAAALALLLLCFLAATGARALNVPDEGRYAEVAREMLRSGDWITPRLDGVPFLDKPPLFYWLEAGAFALFGVHVWSARLVPALLGFAGCALVYAAGARLYGRRAGLLAAIVLAANPYHFGASQYVNHDLAVATWISAALLAFAVGDRREGTARRPWLLAGYAAMGLAVLTKGLIGLVLPLGAVGIFVAIGRRWREVPRYGLPAGLALVAAIAVPWHVVAQHHNPDLLHYLFVVQHFQRFTGSGFNNPIGPAFYPAVLAAGLLPWTPLLPAALARAWRAFRRDPQDGRTDLLLLAWPALVLVFFSIPASKLAGYMLPALPPLALLVGRELDLVLGGERVARGPFRISAALMAGFALVLGVGPFAVAALPGGLPPFPPVQAALLVVGGGVALAASGVTWAAARRGLPHRAVAAMVVFSAALFAAVLPAVPSLVHDSTLPLAQRLRPLVREGDVVASYRRYFYDLPLYLDRREPIVVAEWWQDPGIPRRDNWQRELLLGRLREPASEAWLVELDALALRCRPPVRCFVFVRVRDAAALACSMELVPLAEANGVSLLATAAAAGDGGAFSSPAPVGAGAR
jgi:4-amino-4-deoxy-L-arabinose transferase-like glycosyltransferase